MYINNIEIHKNIIKTTAATTKAGWDVSYSLTNKSFIQIIKKILISITLISLRNNNSVHREVNPIFLYCVVLEFSVKTR